LTVKTVRLQKAELIGAKDSFHNIEIIKYIAWLVSVVAVSICGKYIAKRPPSGTVVDQGGI